VTFGSADQGYALMAFNDDEADRICLLNPLHFKDR